MFVLPLTVSVFDPASFPGNSGAISSSKFGVRVTVGGEDYTDRLIDEVQVDAEEDAARVASFTVVARPGQFEPDSWINLPVSVDYLQDGVAFRLFTGIVDLPNLSIDGKSIVVNCTDDLQGRFTGKERAQIEDVFQGSGAMWSPALFGDYTDSEQFAKDLLSTIARSADIDRNGLLRFGDWYSPGYDYLFLDAEIFPDSVSVEWAGRRDIVNRVDITLEYTYQFFRERYHRYLWNYPRSFPEYLELNTSLPNNDMIKGAAEQTGWRLAGPIKYVRLPPSGEFDLPSGGSTQWVAAEEVRQYVALGADFTLEKRWVQDVKQTFNIAVESPPNIQRYDQLAEEVQATLDTSVEEDGFGAFETTPDLPEISIGSDRAWNSFSSLNLAVAVDTAVAHSKALILSSFRQNSVSFRTLLQPELERYHFARIETDSVTAQGKCRRILHRISVTDGWATTEVDLAVFRGEPSIEGSYNIPAMEYSESNVSTTTTLDTAIQVIDGSVPAPAEDFEGYVGNELPPIAVVENPFDERFALSTPEISEGSRNPVESMFEFTVLAPVYNQDLTVSV